MIIRRRLAATCLLTLGLAGCAGGSWAAGPCAPVEQPPLQAGQHLIGDRAAPVPYSSTPPTSGWHASGPPPFGVATAEHPLSEPAQVSVLEAGGVVVTYRDLSAADRAALEALAHGELAGQIAVTPYDRLAPGEAALTAWGQLQRCDELDLDAVTAFVRAHADPDTPHAH